MPDTDNKVVSITGEPIEPVAAPGVPEPVIVEMCEELLRLAKAGQIHRLACAWEMEGDPAPMSWHRGGITYALVGMMEVTRLKMARDLEQLTTPED